ncbi:hypothetical protein [Saccharopolyspora cebuensis]|uniref:YGGT family protein n=1 Tax=Saccharopolyspora cebuensis TaxID=418759 RepID=A0ABV4CSR3_9PSEU
MTQERTGELRRTWARFVGILTAVVRWVGTVFAAVLAIHVVLTIAAANPDNGITRFIAAWAEPLALGFQDLFMPADPMLEVLLNYGAAALFWLLASGLAARVLRALA